MIRCDAIKISRAEQGVSRHFPITHLNSPTVFESRNTMLGSVIHMAGIPFEKEYTEVLNQYKTSWHRALISLGEEFCIYVTTHRNKQSLSLYGEFENVFLKEVDRQYHSQFQDQSMYVNDIYITLIYRGVMTGKMGKGLHIFEKLVSRTVKKAREWKRQEQMRALEQATQQLMVSLSTFRPHLLGREDESRSHSELLEFLSLFLSQSGSVKFQSPVMFPPISRSIKKASQSHRKYPETSLANYLSNQRIFFGEYIQFQGDTQEANRFAAMVSVKRYATQSVSVMLDSLLQLDCEFINTHSFAIEANDIAQKSIQRHRIKMENVNDPAVSQINALCVAQDLLASDKIKMGYHHNTIMLLSSTLKDLEQAVAKTIKAYADAGFVAIRETIGQEPAFWAQIPTNLNMIARSAMITSENFVDFCPLHNYRTGYRDKNHLGSAVTLLETPSRTPYFFNFHAKGSLSNPSKGHTTIIGGNGSGKTVAMAFFDAQLSRYHGRNFVFDRDRGLEIYLRACGGYYAILSPDYPNDFRFNPLQLDDTPANRKFCREWMSQLIKNDDEETLPAPVMDQVMQCVDYVFEHLEPSHRNLSNAAKLLSIDFSRWSNLRRWLRGDKEHIEGEYAYIFDNEVDDLSMHRKMGFDMTHFLDHEPKSILVALTMYLFHRLETSLDGCLVTVLLDEGWQYLDNDYWQKKLRKWLPTLRKLNCHLVFATQSPASVVESPLQNIILDNCATNIYFSNPQAKREHYIDGFNLTHSEFRSIKENDPSCHLFLLKKEHESCLCKLNLSHMGDVLAVFSGNKSTLNLLEKLRQEVGSNPKKWLPLFYERRLAL